MSFAPTEALYQERILEYFRHPRGKGRLESADATATVHNHLCGEDVTVAITTEGSPDARRVRDIRFLSDGCSITQASASMMTELVPGRSATEIAHLAAQVRDLVQGGPVTAADEALGPLVSLRAVSRVPARTACALLPWDALAAALAQAP